VDQLPAHGEQASLMVEGDLEIPMLVALLDRGEKMLAPVLDPFDRLPQEEACGGERHLLRIHHKLGAEAAADVRRHDPQLIFIETQHGHEKAAHLVGELRRRPEREPVLVGVVDGERAAPLDRVRAAAVLLEIDADAPRGARECIRGVAIALLELGQKITLAGPVRARRLRGERVAAIGDRGQRLVVDSNQGRSIFGNVARPRDHDRHRLADEGDLVLGKRKRRDVARELRRAKLQRQPFLREERRKIGERQYRVHPGAGTRGGGVDAADCSVGVRAAHECRLQHAGKGKIGDEAAFAREQRAIFEPPDRATDGFAFAHSCLEGGEAEALKEPGRVTRDHPFFFCRAFAERGPMGSG
jgi:hypothetical protein